MKGRIHKLGKTPSDGPEPEPRAALMVREMERMILEVPLDQRVVKLLILLAGQLVSMEDEMMAMRECLYYIRDASSYWVKGEMKKKKERNGE